VRYGSVCSGIEAASVAWHGLGWRAAWVSEIEAFPSAVIAARWPGVENLGDMTALPERILARDVEAPDVLVGGTPCQAFSVAGLRGSLSDARGNLTLTFVRIADAIDTVRRADGRAPAWIVWENVPGVLSVADNAFGAFLGGLVGGDAALEPPRGRGWTDAGVVSGPSRCAAWRVLDAQHFGLAQRRRRVFVLARAGTGDWAAADALLPVIESMRWHPAPRREAGQRAAPCLAARTRGGGGLGTDAELDGALIAAPEVSPALKARDYKGPSSDDDGDGAPMIAHAFDARQSNVIQYGDRTGPLDTDGHSVAVAFAQNTRDEVREMPVVGALAAQPGMKQTSYVRADMQVRRLTPRECERLQGFPDDYTAISWRGKPPSDCPDGPRYKALGNSMAVPVMRWIGERIAAVDQAG
jgi:DNA (cytosine-5)-methyltransferase 1